MNMSPQFSSPLSPGDQLLQPNLRLRVGEHIIDVGALRIVTRPACPRLTGKAVAVLLELARHAGDTVTREQLLNRVWKDRVTTPDVLTQAIKELRRAFVDDAKPSSYIETIPKVGYRLLVPVCTIEVAAVMTLAGQRFAASGGNMTNTVDIANRAPQTLNRRTGTPIVWRWLIVVACVLILVTAGIVAVTKRASTDRAAAGWQAIDIRAITSDPGPERRPRVSPDGTRVAYSQLDPSSGFERIVVRSVDQSQAIHLTARATADEDLPTWSPDGTQIAFQRVANDGACTLYVAPSLGGSDHEIGPCGNYLADYFDWLPDGKALITSGDLTSAMGTAQALMVLDLATGRKLPLQYQRTASDQDIEARYSPNGRWIAFRRGFAPHSDLYLTQATGGVVRQMTHLSARIMGYTWTPDGRSLIFSSNPEGGFALYTVDIEDGQVHALNVTPAAYPDAARAGGTVVYEIPRTKNTLAEVTVDPQLDKPRLLAPSTGDDSAPAFSPDGKRIAFVSDRNGSQQIWLYELDGSEPLALTDYRGAVIWNPNWSADGGRLLATVRMAGSASLVEIDVASSRRRTVAKSQSTLLCGSYGPEPGSYLLIRRAADARGELVMLQNADTANERAIPLASAVEHAEFDPATHMVYYIKSGAQGVFRRDLAGGAEQLTQHVSSATMDGWRLVDGRIWYVTAMMMNPFDLREFDPASGADRQLVHVKAQLGDANFSVAPSHDRVIFAPMGAEDIDVGAFELSRADTH